MLLAETVTFDPGVAVLIVVVFLTVVLTAIAVVIGGIVAGFRAGADPSRSGARTVWTTCVVLEGALLLFAVLKQAAFPLFAIAAAIFALTVLAKVTTPAR